MAHTSVFRSKPASSSMAWCSGGFQPTDGNTHPSVWHDQRRRRSGGETPCTFPIRKNIAHEGERGRKGKGGASARLLRAVCDEPRSVRTCKAEDSQAVQIPKPDPDMDREEHSTWGCRSPSGLGQSRNNQRPESNNTSNNTISPSPPETLPKMRGRREVPYSPPDRPWPFRQDRCSSSSERGPPPRSPSPFDGDVEICVRRWKGNSNQKNISTFRNRSSWPKKKFTRLKTRTSAWWKGTTREHGLSLLGVDGNQPR